MSETNKTIVRRFYEDVFSKGDLDAVDELVAAGCVEHTPPPGLESTDVREALKEFTQMLRAAIPDLRVAADEVIADGNLVAAYWKAEGTHEHELMAMPGTGQRVSFAGLDLLRVVDGQCTDHWGFDNLLLQLGGRM